MVDKNKLDAHYIDEARRFGEFVILIEGEERDLTIQAEANTIDWMENIKDGAVVDKNVIYACIHALDASRLKAVEGKERLFLLYQETADIMNFPVVDENEVYAAYILAFRASQFEVTKRFFLFKQETADISG